ncbi:MAG: DegT/DnrJ/EryC1/StrS family aminotransferase, partial [Proteobacteria bacterium]|nr:DegT/DnrJ/EryC1/StrS family aminotransferase [Pseudomonadota bacterium]
HLYGHPVDMDSIMKIANAHGLPVIEDTAQAMGAEYKGVKVGGIGTIGCISFFPSKNLGAFGDAGMVVTNDEKLAEKLRMIAVHGSRVRYRHEMLGINSRLDSLQAAILKVKLRYLEQWHQARRDAAARYNRLFRSAGVVLPSETPFARHIYHQYTIRLKNRDAVAQHLSAKGIPHAIYYPIPLYLQEAYAGLGGKRGDFPVTERAADEVLSLPMHTELTEEQQAQIATAVIDALPKT